MYGTLVNNTVQINHFFNIAISRKTFYVKTTYFLPNFTSIMQNQSTTTHSTHSTHSAQPSSTHTTHSEHSTQPTTLPNHFWCVQCSRQYLLTDKYSCVNETCNANYCKNCILDFHATYFNIPKPSGELPSSNSIAGYLRYPRCRYCNMIFGRTFYKLTGITPVSRDNLLTLKKERDGIRVNYLQDQIRLRQQNNSQVSQQQIQSIFGVTYV